MKLTVNIASRNAKMRAHTATHLLHFALDKMLWGTKQAWSLVDEDFLRFDFAIKKPLTSDQLKNIEIQINQRIYQAIPVSNKEMSYEKAITTGAKAFFEDKYGDKVRLVSIRPPWNKVEQNILWSIELCGGTHVNNTKNIGTFTILSQEAVASGVRRITAITGPKTIEHIHDLHAQLWLLSATLDCQPKQLTEKLTKVIKDYKKLQENYESIQTQIISSQLQALFPLHYEHFTIFTLTKTPLENSDFKNIVNQAKQLRPEKNRLLVNSEGNFALYAGNGDFSAREYAKSQWRKWWWSAQLVQGRDKKVGEIIG